MLLSLHVKNFAIIDEVWVDFGSGLNVLTGETGAGKSILLGAVNMALGGKVNKEMIGQNADFCLAELIFSGEDSKTESILKEYDLPVEENLIITRKISENGRSVSRINGETVSAGALKAVAACLIDIHGQHEHQSLLYKSSHLAMLDRFGKAELGGLVEEVKTSYHAYKEAQEQLSEAACNEEERNRKLAMLQFEISELEAANLRIGEDEELEERYRVLQHASRIQEAVSSATEYIGSGRENAEEYINRAIQRLSKVSDLDPHLAELYEQLGLVQESLTDLSASLSDYAEEMSGTEEEFSLTGERLDVLNKIKSRYGKTIEKSLQYLEEAKKERETMENYDDYVAGLRSTAEKAEKTFLAAAGKVSAIRIAQAKLLSEEIREALEDLNFLDVKFEIAVAKADKPNEKGLDEAEFFICTNPGEPLRPLSKIASGGELSRVMLALKSVTAGRDEIGTLIFDEIDTGVSGRTAQKVAEKMALIGGTRQVICITHLPQIAAMGDAHFRIEKHSDGERTKTSITALSESERVEELARILGGAEITASVMENAREMKTLAEDKKSDIRQGKR